MNKRLSIAIYFDIENINKEFNIQKLLNTISLSM